MAPIESPIYHVNQLNNKLDEGMTLKKYRVSVAIVEFAKQEMGPTIKKNENMLFRSVRQFFLFKYFFIKKTPIYVSITAPNPMIDEIKKLLNSKLLVDGMLRLTSKDPKKTPMRQGKPLVNTTANAIPAGGQTTLANPGGIDNKRDALPTIKQVIARKKISKIGLNLFELGSINCPYKSKIMIDDLSDNFFFYRVD